MDGLKAPITIIPSILFIYCIHVIPGIAFGSFLQATTDGNYGVMETLLATGLSGVFYSVTSGQPLIIVGVTGPVSIFSTTLYSICKALSIPFLPFMFWVCLWAAVMHALLGIYNLCSFVSIVTRFTCEVFGCLIGVVFISEGIKDIVKHFGTDSVGALGGGVWSLLLTIITVGMLFFLSSAKKWLLFPRLICTVIADYSMPITVIVVSLLSGIAILSPLGITRLVVPQSFTTTSGRSWLVSPGDASVGMIFAAALPALVLTILIFFDHNVSSLLSQSRAMRLKKPPAYNYDFTILGFTLILTGILGLPCTHGLIPQAPLHVVSLAKFRSVTKVVDGVPRDAVRVESVVENRTSNFVMSVLVVLTAVCPPILRAIGLIPNAVLAGIFLFMGFSSFFNNQFASRCCLFVCNPSYRSLYFEHIAKVPFKTVLAYTGIQIACLIAIFGVTLTQAAISFPVLIALLVPVRIFLVSRFFSKEHVELLDGSEVEKEVEEVVEDEVLIGGSSEPEFAVVTEGGLGSSSASLIRDAVKVQ
ncbi:Boron transporter 1 [Dinochytrium kinnereticum]|nr:Boron transporter 1 [Dinochytrium kinnereticum]